MILTVDSEGKLEAHGDFVIRCVYGALSDSVVG